MACFSLHGVRMEGLAVTLPVEEVRNTDLEWLSPRERMQMTKMVGIDKRRVAPASTTAADLCVRAAEELLARLGWKAEEIGAILFVTQTPDHLIPGSATQIQERLGIPRSALALDVNQGCAGYVYGLGTLGALQAAGKFPKTLLLVGDTITHTLSPQDKSTVPIFSDAGSATALVYDPSASPMHFNLQSDGSGYQAIIQPAGGARQPITPETTEIRDQGDGLFRADAHLAMRGLDVFNFALAEVAPNIRQLLEFAGQDQEEVDHFVFHQANLLLNESIRKKLRVPKEKVPYTLSKYGNTSCGTIPVTMADQLQEALTTGGKRMVLSGFGVGLAWGSVLMEMPPIHCLAPIEV